MFFCFAAASLFAQTKLTYKNNGLNIGDVRNMKQIEYLPQGDGGANQVWDFSKAKVLKDMAIAQNANVANPSRKSGFDLAQHFVCL